MQIKGEILLFFLLLFFLISLILLYFCLKNKQSLEALFTPPDPVSSCRDRLFEHTQTDYFSFSQYLHQTVSNSFISLRNQNRIVLIKIELIIFFFSLSLAGSSFL